MVESSPNLLKILLEKEKLLVVGNFYFSYNVFKKLAQPFENTVEKGELFSNQELVWERVNILTLVFCFFSYQVTKFPLQSCSVYSECSSCVSSGDPLGCGWCGNQCTQRDECTDPNTKWSHNTCKPYIKEVGRV